MDYLTLMAGVWVAVFIILGIIRGFWTALAAILSLVGAYFAAAYFAPKLTEFLLVVFEPANLGETVTWAASATLIFVLAGLVIRLAVVLISRSVPVTNRPLDAIGGALFSGLYGATMAVIMIWGVALLIETYEPQQVAKDVQVAQSEPQVKRVTPQVVIWSRELMADAMAWNARQNGASDETARLVAAYAKQPQDVLDAVQTSVRSDEFKQVINSDNVQRIVREQDVEALHNSPEFKQLVQQPGVQKLRSLIAPDGAGWSDKAMAKQMVELWGGIDQISSNPEVSALVDDPEVQAFLQEGGSITPSLLAKGQKFLRVLASGSGQIPAVNELPELYQWNDDAGQLHVTEYQEIPPSKQDQAEKIPL